jgi:DNA-binding LacI/PurR family transcriptional regulator
MAEENGLPAVLIARSVEGAERAGLPRRRRLRHRARHQPSDLARPPRIAMIGGTDQTSTGRDRYQGYVNAMEKAGLEVGRPGAFPDRAPSRAASRRPPVPGAEGQADRRLSAGTISSRSA